MIGGLVRQGTDIIADVAAMNGGPRFLTNVAKEPKVDRAEGF